MPKMRDVGQDIRNSRNAFVNLVWPAIRDKWFDGAELEPVEGEADSLKYSMDTKAGIDYWSVGDGLVSIASRVQNRAIDYGTFTVRADRNNGTDTELQKRTRENSNDELSPTWMVQAYIDAPWREHDDLGKVWIVESGEVLNAARAKQSDVISWVNNGTLGTHYGENGTGSNQYIGENEDFYYIHWRDYNRYRKIDWLNNPNIQARCANVLIPRVDPKTNQPPENQDTLDGYGD